VRRIDTPVLLIIILVLSFALTACANKRVKPDKDDYSGQARYTYEMGIDNYDSSEYIEAIKNFNFVRTKYPYSKFAALSSLRIADTYYAQELMPDAIEAYRRFIQLHPTHPEVPYAHYRVGMAHYEQLPDDWFFLPPAYEKDLASTQEALGALKKFVELYPNNQFAADINEKAQVVRQRLADHEFYVATFYIKREKPRAAARRLEGLLANYSGVGFDQEALFLLGKSYLMLKDVPRAVETWRRLIDGHTSHPLAIKANSYISEHKLDSEPARP
jgi:outer membrane protein assembly factor BamD